MISENETIILSSEEREMFVKKVGIMATNILGINGSKTNPRELNLANKPEIAQRVTDVINRLKERR